jgi:uncharacterized protein YndB with AHSA1/START domain
VTQQRDTSPVGSTEVPFTILRIFNAPRELVWKAWTEPEHLKHWWGPKGFTWMEGTMDFRPRGIFHYGMRSPAGHEMWGKFLYREIVPPERLVFTVSFSDKERSTLRHPLSSTWPLEVLNTITLIDQQGKTTVTLRGVPVNATEEEQRTFKASYASMHQGFKGTMDQLDEYLTRAASRK